jgi:hypothetical protein
MSRIDKKIDDYLNEDEDILDEEIDMLYDDAEIMDKMLDFITNLEDLPEDKAVQVLEIIELIDPEVVDEAMAAKRVKIDRQAKRKRKREYRKQRAKMKMKGKKFRRTAKYKKYKRMKKRKAKSGKTSTGKRIRKFI